MCLYAFQFCTCKVRVDAFSLLYSKLLFAKSSCLVPILLHRIGNLLAYVAALYVSSICLLLSVRGPEGKA